MLAGVLLLPRARTVSRLAPQALLVMLALWFAVFRLPAPAVIPASASSAVGVALLSVLLAWATAAGALLWLFLSVSLENSGDLAWRAVRVAVPAMWYPPAILLLSSMTPVAVTIGVLLVANTTRLIVSGVALRRSSRSRRRAHAGPTLFRYAVRQNLFTRETMPVLAAAFAFHAGLFCLYARYPLAGSALLAGSIAIWTWRAVRSGAAPPPTQTGSGRTLLSAVLTLLLAFSLSLAQFGNEAKQPANTAFTGTAHLVWQRLARGAPTRPETAGKPAGQVTRLKLIIPARDLVPGVILRPERKTSRRTLTTLSGLAGMAIAVGKPLDFPFTGEYHLFPTASRRVQRDSAVYSGTPLDAVFMNTSGGSVETQAWQEFRPVIDLTNCAALQVNALERGTDARLRVRATDRYHRCGGAEVRDLRL